MSSWDEDWWSGSNSKQALCSLEMDLRQVAHVLFGNEVQAERIP